MEKTIQITFLGDLTLDRRMLQAAGRSDGTFEFGPSFKEIPGPYASADAVVGNLETVCGGPKDGYNPWAIGYNSPDELLTAFRAIGVTALTTANNHALDQEKRGLRRTIDLMDRLGFDHTGTFKNKKEKRYTVLTVGGIRIGLVAFADALNRTPAGALQSKSALELVNHLRPYPKRKFHDHWISFLASFLPIKEKKRKEADERAKKGVKIVKPRIDNDPLKDEEIKRIRLCIDVLKEARKECDYLVACIHTGGQFNGEPGTRCTAIYDMLKPYADAIMGNHAHVAQRIETYEGKGVLAYALGGLTMSVGADYVTHDDHPEFSIGVHLYLTKNDEGKTALDKATFTLYHGREDEKGYLFVTPVDHEGCPGDTEAMRTVFKRIAGYEFPGFQTEYPIPF